MAVAAHFEGYFDGVAHAVERVVGIDQEHGVVGKGAGVGGTETAGRHAARKSLKRQLGRVEDHYLNGKLTAYKELLLLVGRGAVKVYCPDSGNSYTATGIRFADTVFYSGRTYHRFFFDGAVINETGLCTLYVEQLDQHPVASSYFDLPITVSGSETDVYAPIRSFRGRRIQIVGASAMRKVSGAVASCTVNLVTFNNGVVAGTEMGSVSMASGIALGTMTINATNYPTGIFLDLRDSNTLYGVRVGELVGWPTGTLTLHCKAYL